jgi:hypothetical protein
MTEARYSAIAGLVFSDVAPTANDDTDHGYNRTTLWFNTVTGALYISIADTIRAASWREVVTSTRAPNAIAAPKVNRTAADPTTAADTLAGYAAGSLWINSSDGGAFICTDATAAAAVWEELTVVT